MYRLSPRRCLNALIPERFTCIENKWFQNLGSVIAKNIDSHGDAPSSNQDQHLNEMAVDKDLIACYLVHTLAHRFIS